MDHTRPGPLIPGNRGTRQRCAISAVYLYDPDITAANRSFRIDLNFSDRATPDDKRVARGACLPPPPNIFTRWCSSTFSQYPSTGTADESNAAREKGKVARPPPLYLPACAYAGEGCGGTVAGTCASKKLVD